MLIPDRNDTIFDSKPFRDETSAINYLIKHNIFNYMIAYKIDLESYGYSRNFRDAYMFNQYDINRLEAYVTSLETGEYDNCYNESGKQRIKEDQFNCL